MTAGVSSLSVIEEAADDLNVVLDEAEEAFERAFAAPASVPLAVPSGGVARLAYAKAGELYRLFVVRGLPGNESRTPVASCSIAVRIEAAHALPRLVEACRAAAADQLAAIRHAAVVARAASDQLAAIGEEIGR